MRVSELITYALLQATVIVASPHDARNKKVTPSKRPNHAVGPHHPSKALPASPDRTKTCIVQACGNGKDDSANILKAIKDCNNGGHVVFPKDQKFTIGTALDLTFLNKIDLGTALDVHGSFEFMLT
jgi:galacturan 1,4-alpha-galacturonidase